jgi:hypothetical protein
LNIKLGYLTDFLASSVAFDWVFIAVFQETAEFILFKMKRIFGISIAYLGFLSVFC